MIRRLSILFALSACVGDSNTLPDAGQDATTDAPPIDATTDAAPACDPQKAFNTPTLVPNVNTPDNDFGRTWNDTTMYVWSGRAGGSGGFDFWISARASTSVAFSVPTNIPLGSGDGLNSTTTDISVSLTSDGLTAYFATSRSRTDGIGDIWVATRATTTADFANAAALANVNDPTFDDTHPFLTADGTLYFASARAGNYDIYRTMKSGGAFGAPAVVTEISSSSDDTSPMLDAAQLTIYFASARPGGVGGVDIWTATRTSTAVAFSAPTNAASLNTNLDDFPIGLSSDGCVLYLASNRAGTTGNNDIWQAIRPK